jgi:hypothetical protein
MQSTSASASEKALNRAASQVPMELAERLSNPTFLDVLT